MHVKLVDANSLGYIQHHAQDIRHSGDLQTQAVAGVLSHVRRSLQYEPEVLHVFVWDGRAQWRYDLHPGYKAGRTRTAEQRQSRLDYERQRPWIQRALAAFPVLQVTHPNAEADDVAWGLARQLGAQGHLVTVNTSDTDWLQMVGPRVRWLNARRPGQLVDHDNFHRLSGYGAPSHVAQVKALTGDDSDDIPGLPDVAQKRASALLGKYGSIQAVLEAANDLLLFSEEPKYFHTLMTPEGQELVRRNLQLVDLARAPALQGDSVALVEGEFNELELFEVFVDLEFRQLQDAFDGWARTLNRELNAADVYSVRRAVQSIQRSWEHS